MSNSNNEIEPEIRLGFDDQDNLPINYLQRIRHYYQTLGYGKPYRWAQFRDVPFTPLKKPLSQCRVGLVTTAAPFQSDRGDQGPGAPYNSAAKFYTVYALPANDELDLRISHVGYDRKHTSATDSATWLPLKQLEQVVTAGRIAAASANVYGMPTNRSQITTIERDCFVLAEKLQNDQVDVAILLPNCPVCHQCISLAARHLEEQGIPTVMMACARDIVEHVGVPRLLFSDFPLGNASGRADDIESQRQTFGMALDLLESATMARTTVQSPLQWSNSPDWKKDFYNIDILPATEVDALRAEFDRQKQVAKQQRSNEGL